MLRRRHIKTLMMGGIVTNIGVESTARAAYDRGYGVMGRVRTTAELIDALQAGTGEA